MAHKLYLSAILDLYDRRIVSNVLSEHNGNPLVYKTFDKAVNTNPDAHPLFHSDRGPQYTGRAFHYKLQQAGMTQSMSCVCKRIDNGPMEGLWGILKRERYYGRRFGLSTVFFIRETTHISYGRNTAFSSPGPAADTNAPLVFPAPRWQRGPCKKHGINEKDGRGNPDVMALHNPPPYQPAGAGPKPALSLGVFTDFP